MDCEQIFQVLFNFEVFANYFTKKSQAQDEILVQSRQQKY